MYEYIPQKSNKKAMYLVCVFLIGGVALMFASGLIKGFSFVWVFQLIGIGLCAASIFIFTRYVSKGYIYRVDENGDLTITERQGRKLVTVCRLSISQLESVESFETCETERTAEMKKRIRKEKRKYFNYCVDIAPAQVCYLFSSECGEAVAVILQPDETLLTYFSFVKEK